MAWTRSTRADFSSANRDRLKPGAAKSKPATTKNRACGQFRLAMIRSDLPDS